MPSGDASKRKEGGTDHTVPSAVDSGRSEPNLNPSGVSVLLFLSYSWICFEFTGNKAQLVEQTILKMNNNMQILQIPVRKFLRSFVNCLQLKDVWRALSSFNLSSAAPPPVPRRSLVICCCHLTVEETPRCSSSPPSQQFLSTPSGNVAQKPVIAELPASSSSPFSNLFSSFFNSTPPRFHIVIYGSSSITLLLFLAAKR